MKVNNPWPLWAQITVAFIVVTLIVTYASGEFIRQSETKRLLKLTQTQLDQTISAVSAIIIDAVITEDVSVLETVVEQLGNVDNNIYSVKIDNEDGRSLINWHNNQNTYPENMLSFKKTIGYKGEIFGVFKLEWNVDDLYADITKQVGHVRLITIIAMLILTLIFAIGIHMLVIRPLRIIDERLLDHASGKTIGHRRFWAAKEFQHVNHTIDRLESLTTSKKALEKEIALRSEAETALILARDEALEANKAKSQFLANMSHELRTPLNAIIGFSEMMKEDFQKEKGNQHETYIEDLECIETSGIYLLSLIDDILDLAKIEAHKMKLNLKYFSFQKVLQEVIDMVQPLVQKNVNTLELHYSDDIGKIFADKTKIRQILFNLISNACKFTQGGKVILSVNLIQNPGLDLVSVSVTDTGIGISDADIRKLFLPFSQLDSSNTREYGGTGLGLALSRQLCRSMAGNIEAESEPGKGSTFTFWIPMDVAAKLESDRQHKPDGMETQDSEQVLTGQYDDRENEIVLAPFLS